MTRLVLDTRNDREVLNRAGTSRRKLRALLPNSTVNKLLRGEAVEPNVDKATCDKLLALMPEVARYVRGEL